MTEGGTTKETLLMLYAVRLKLPELDIPSGKLYEAVNTAISMLENDLEARAGCYFGAPRELLPVPKDEMPF